MLIEFRCTNLSDFDAAKGRYIECDELIIASDDKVGKLVKCPKCDQMVEVPLNYEGAESATRAGQADTQRSVGRSPVKQKADVRADAMVAQNIVKPAIAESATDRNADSLKPGNLFSDDVEDSAGSEGPRTVHDVNRKRCPQCGSSLDDHGKCSLCHYVEPQFESKTARLEDIHVQLAGFQLWVSEIVSEGASFSTIAVVASSLFAFACLILTLIAVLVGEILWAVILACVFVVYVLAVFKAWQLTKNPRARLNFWQRPFWNLVLSVARILNWQKYDNRYAGRKIINLRNAPIVDEKVAYLEDLGNCQVLDLENTLITDKGLVPLYGLNQLHCLVVRRTAVTQEGIFRLQQANPRLWIWD